MKKLLLILLCLPMIFSSCEEEDNSPTNSGNNVSEELQGTLVGYEELEGTWIGYEFGDNLNYEWKFIFFN